MDNSKFSKLTKLVAWLMMGVIVVSSLAPLAGATVHANETSISTSATSAETSEKEADSNVTTQSKDRSASTTNEKVSDPSESNAAQANAPNKEALSTLKKALDKPSEEDMELTTDSKTVKHAAEASDKNGEMKSDTVTITVPTTENEAKSELDAVAKDRADAIEKAKVANFKGVDSLGLDSISVSLFSTMNLEQHQHDGDKDWAHWVKDLKEQAGFSTWSKEAQDLFLSGNVPVTSYYVTNKQFVEGKSASDGFRLLVAIYSGAYAPYMSESQRKAVYNDKGFEKYKDVEYIDLSSDLKHLNKAWDLQNEKAKSLDVLTELAKVKSFDKDLHDSFAKDVDGMKAEAKKVNDSQANVSIVDKLLGTIHAHAAADNINNWRGGNNWRKDNDSQYTYVGGSISNNTMNSDAGNGYVLAPNGKWYPSFCIASSYDTGMSSVRMAELFSANSTGAVNRFSRSYFDGMSVENQREFNNIVYFALQQAGILGPYTSKPNHNLLANMDVLGSAISSSRFTDIHANSNPRTLNYWTLDGKNPSNWIAQNWNNINIRRTQTENSLRHADESVSKTMTIGKDDAGVDTGIKVPSGRNLSPGLPVKSSDGTFEAFNKNGNIWVKPIKDSNNASTTLKFNVGELGYGAQTGTTPIAYYDTGGHGQMRGSFVGYIGKVPGWTITLNVKTVQPVTLPHNGNPDNPTNKLGISKAVSLNGVSTSNVVKSHSSNDAAQYDISFDFMSRGSHVYNTYAWAEKDKSFTTKTIEQNYQSVIDIKDDLPKGFKVDDIAITTKDGRSLTVKKDYPRGVMSNVTNESNKDFANYWIYDGGAGETGDKLHVQYITGDHDEDASKGQLNDAKITIKGHLVETELPTPNSSTGIGRVNNKASVQQVVQVWNREHISGASTKAQPYNFTSNDKDYIKKDNAFDSNKDSNTVGIDVQAYQLTARYMTLNDNFKRQGNLVSVPIGNTKANTWNSGWVYPHVTTAIPTPSKTTTQSQSSIYDLNTSAIHSTKKGDAWVTKNIGKDNKDVTIPDSQPFEYTLDSESLLNSSKYQSTWYRNLTDLTGKTHKLDQITDLTSGKTSEITTSNGETTNFTMPDSSQALSVYYGQKAYDVKVHHYTTKASNPSYTSFDEGANPIVSGNLVNQSGPNVFQRGLKPHIEKYKVHEGEVLNYNPQVTSILQNATRWSLSESFTKINNFNFVTGSNPKVNANGTFASVSLEYEKDEALNQGADINLNPETLTIDTDQSNKGLPFKLDLKAKVGGQWKWFESLGIPGFDLKDYTYNVIIKHGDKVVYSTVVSPNQMSRNGDEFTHTLTGRISTDGAADGSKIPYNVLIVPDTSHLQALDYTGPEGNVPIHVHQTMETETDANHMFSSAGYTASNLKLTSDYVTKNGQLSVPENKMVVQTVATRAPHGYTEHHENWTLSVPKDVTTLTGYSLSGAYPITYSVDKVSGRPLVDLKDKFQLRYSRGLNADTALSTYIDEKSGKEVDPNDKSATLSLKTDSGSKDVDANGVLTRFATQETPDVSVEEGTGKVSSNSAPNGHNLKDGGSRIYISEWIKNVPSVQPMIFETRPNVKLGANNISFEFTQNVTLSGYLHGHAESDTSATDAILMQPVDRGATVPVDGFTYTQDDKKWLTNDDWFK